MITQKIKPLSINACWRGRRFKTPEYKSYEKELLYTLPQLTVPKNTPLRLKLEVGFSNNGSDLSNTLKAFEDILQKKYGFNDKWIYEINMIKKITEKGSEYISFSITED